MPSRHLGRTFYSRDTLLVARELLGMHLVHETRAGRIVGRVVETEAYQGPEDLAAHSARARSERTEVMFGPAGFAYVYMIYGMWNCLNVVTRTREVPHAVLIRAVEPISGVESNTHGPGLLCRAFSIDRTHSGLDMTKGSLSFERPAKLREVRVATAPRIGIDYAGRWAKKQWRFFDADSPYVSTVSASVRRKRIAEIKLAPRAE